MVPSSCAFEADLRLPIGMAKADLLPKIAGVAARCPEATWREVGGSEPSWCDPDHEMVGIIQRNVEAFGRPRPPQSSASVAPMRGSGGTSACRLMSTDLIRTEWARMTNTSQSRSSYMSCAHTSFLRTTT